MQMLCKHCSTVWLQIIVREDSLYILRTDANTRGLLPGELPWLVESVNVAVQTKNDCADLQLEQKPSGWPWGCPVWAILA